MTKSAPASLEDRTLAKYQVIKEIGKGSMGTVYLGHDPFIDRPVAIKVADQERLNSEEDGDFYRKLFFNEAQAAGMLKHPNITSIFDAGADNGVYYIVMEYVHGGKTLEDYCSIDSLLPIEAIIALVYKCAVALDYAHKKGVIHRDIKPRNILVTEEREVKISDFGVAVMAGDTELRALGSAGSPLYMSPEQVRHEPVTPQSDIFSLGVVMYELLTGKHPFGGGNIDAIQHLIQDISPPPLRSLRADVPEVLERIVSRALAKDPRSRYKTAMDLAGDLSLVFDFIEPAKESVSRQEKFNILRAFDFFRDFNDNEIWEMLNASQWLDFKEGDTVITEGDLDKSFYVIVAGAVTVTKAGRYVDTLESGDCFGEMGYVSGQHRSASIRTNVPTTLVKVHSSLIERASVNCQLRFHKLFLHTLIARLSRATDRIVAGETAASAAK